MALSDKMCDGITTPEQMRTLCVEQHKEIVQTMMAGYKQEIIKGKEPSTTPTVFVIGGQNASGKSKLISELEKQNDGKSDSVQILIDEMKAYHPFRSYIDVHFIDQSEELLHMACFEVFDRLFEELLSENYDIIIERTLGSLDKARDFMVKPANHDYNIEIHVTATHELNSLLSALERFVSECKLKDTTYPNLDPRPIAIEHHDGTYKNICSVVNRCEAGEFSDDEGRQIFPTVVIWDRTPENPTKIYQTGDGQYTCANHAIRAGRERDFQRCNTSEDPSIGFSARLQNVEADLSNPGETLSRYLDYCRTFIDTWKARAKECGILSQKDRGTCL